MEDWSGFRARSSYENNDDNLLSDTDSDTPSKHDDKVNTSGFDIQYFYRSEDDSTPRNSFFQLTKTKSKIILIIASLIIIVNEVATFLLERKVYKPKGKQAEDFYEKYKNNSRFLTMAMVLIIFAINMIQLKVYRGLFFNVHIRHQSTITTFMVANVLIILAFAIIEIVRHFVSNKFYTEYNRYFVSALALIMILFTVVQRVFLPRICYRPVTEE